MKTLFEISQLLRERREALNLSQKDMLMKIGMSQQQYQRIEAGGDTRLSTLLRVLEGMDLELTLVPKNQVADVKKLINVTSFDADSVMSDRSLSTEEEFKQDSEPGNRWNEVLKGLED
ncbi:MAG: transcriptional regulator [Piscirickettsiaceae bacterium CG_4_9_14_3_um_filter_43_564]|nr:helix-turn-helix domain-containing protein [Thiomicrospira sp.]OIP95218.1 MAG: transcriptional regulator [Thiomicrospira sp. CG2_30_44_34]PIQ03904.1 MAG: transcriptional regulator [Piscirickettsiaceae bacterium CG18_big_fil_WC_8_21_14_2_50_44_103]PIU38458.1 MAG: transcriptional regulator [Piscirickettsiaceae bacterium CG07_land_8_20_14_0_80_44_28]PIW57902.1 MAG: transcriptional regulator [Piscirickettsiaceae bacterium CG12_big_fil_rev_8_21_14_0_65_44_934]PIW77441.1 MAG: transcriptional regu